MSRKIKRIMLINPPRVIYKGRERKRVDFPLGLGYLGAMLKLEGYEVQGLDVLLEGFDQDEELGEEKIRFGLNSSQIRERIDSFAPDVVGVSNLFTDGAPSALSVCDLVKSVDSDIITLIGGFHPSSAPEYCLRKKSVDYIVLGEGEYSTGMLLRKIEKNADLTRFPGVAFRTADGEIIINPPIEPIQGLDILPWPDRELFPVFKYAEIGKPHGDELEQFPYTTIITSRGCTARCVFCAAYHVHGRRFRPRTPDNVLDEMEFLVKKMGFRELHIEDDNLTHQRSRAKMIFQGMIDRKLNISWTGSNGIALYNLDEELLTLMRQSGCYALWLPVESGDPEILKMIKKPMPYKRVSRLVHIMKDLGIKTKGFFMYGFPGETVEQMERTFQFAKMLDLDYSTFFLATPLPGTELWSMALKENPDLAKSDFDVERLKYARSNVMTGGLSLEEMERTRKKVWLKVNWDLEEDEQPPPGM
ncbi:cobalamin-dependent protein [bacterium]|nr:cobalamin-dependent protein [candidate division CSSED10-310 bacterium]